MEYNTTIKSLVIYTYLKHTKNTVTPTVKKWRQHAYI